MFPPRISTKKLPKNPEKFFTHYDRVKPKPHTTEAIFWALDKIFQADVHIEGSAPQQIKEHLQSKSDSGRTGQLIIVSNHSSRIDPCANASMGKQILEPAVRTNLSIMAFSGVYNLLPWYARPIRPMWRRGLDGAGAFPIWRAREGQGTESEQRKTVNRLAEQLNVDRYNSGMHVLMYGEGQTNKADRKIVHAFQPGLGRLLQHIDHSIPTAIWPIGHYHDPSASVNRGWHVVVGDLIAPDWSSEEAPVQQVADVIQPRVQHLVDLAVHFAEAA